MKLQTGYFRADHEIRKALRHREFGPGETIFEEGAPASGLFVVVSGTVEIVKATETGEVRLSELGPDSVFGEMGLIDRSATRSATARAVEPTTLLEVQENPVMHLKEIGEISAVLDILKQLICVLGDWLRSKNERDLASPAGTIPAQSRGVIDPESVHAAEIIKSRLPKGLFRRAPKIAFLRQGDYLCRQGERPDGFYFIHSGPLEVLATDSASREDRMIGCMSGPTVAGELGYFSRETRAVSLRASGEVAYTHFSGAEFEKLEDSRADEALDILFAAAQLIVHLIRERERDAAG